MSALPTTLPADILQHHPCFSERAHNEVGRVHLPVAPRCNIHCNFCERRICANLTLQHPGWARRLLCPEEAAQLVDDLAGRRPGECFVVGVAGPGEPLANPETFATLARIHRKHPALMKCVSTNGLLLEQELPRLIEVGVSALTITVNAPDSRIGQHIYAWVRHQGVVYRGQEASEILIASQMHGIQAALEAGLVLKINTVLIPGVNDRHMTRLARHLRDAGVCLMNIMPLIPAGRMKDRRAPTCRELIEARSDCSRMVPQFRRCEQCSADVVRFPQEFVQSFYSG
jgi:nitrogen fixation protein NifB